MAEEAINMKYESKYYVHILDPLSNHKLVMVRAKKIVIGDVYTTFYDYYGSVSGSFRNDTLLGYTKED